MHPNQGGPHAWQGQGPTVHHIRAQTRQDVGASTTHTAGASTTLLSCPHALAHRVSPSAACPPYRAASDHARVAQSLGASCASQRTGGTARLAGVPRIGQDRGRRWACRRAAEGGSTDSTVRKHTSTEGSRAARKHAHPARAQAHKAASQLRHAPVDESHPPLEAAVSPVPAAVGRSRTGAPLPLIHDRPASRGTVRPHTCAGPKPVTCSHNPTLPPSPPRRPTAAPFAARGPPPRTTCPPRPLPCPPHPPPRPPSCRCCAAWPRAECCATSVRAAPRARFCSWLESPASAYTLCNARAIAACSRPAEPPSAVVTSATAVWITP